MLMAPACDHRALESATSLGSRVVIFRVSGSAPFDAAAVAVGVRGLGAATGSKVMASLTPSVPMTRRFRPPSRRRWVVGTADLLTARENLPAASATAVPIVGVLITAPGLSVRR